MNRQPMIPISDEQIAEYRRTGVIMLRQVFDQDWLDLLARGMAYCVANPTWRMHNYALNEATGERFFYDAFKIRDVKEFERFGIDSPMAEIAGRMMGAKSATAFYHTIFVRSPGCGARTPWHRDQTGWCANGNGLSIWASIEAVPRSSALEFIPGSHLWPGNFKRVTFNDNDLGRMRDVPGMEDAKPMPDFFGKDRHKYEIVGWDMQPGDCLVFHARTMHGGAGNLPPGMGRRTVSTQWLSEESRVVQPPGGADPDWIEDLAKYGIKIGDHPGSDMCPVVWCAS